MSYDLSKKLLPTPTVKSLANDRSISGVTGGQIPHSQSRCTNVEQYKKENADIKQANDKQSRSCKTEPFRIRLLPNKDNALSTNMSEAGNSILKFFTLIEKFQELIATNANDSHRFTNILNICVDEKAVPETASTAASEVSQYTACREKLEKNMFMIPSTIVLPLSQVFELFMEYPPNESVRMLTDGCRPADRSTGETTKTAKNELVVGSDNIGYPERNMTKIIYEIGLSLVAESAYHGLVTSTNEVLKITSGEKLHAHMDLLQRLLRETADHGRLRKKEWHRCSMIGCRFSSATQMQLDSHKLCPHKRQWRWRCGLCVSNVAYNKRDIDEHYLRVHNVRADWGEPAVKVACPLCDADFPTHKLLRLHFRPGVCPLYDQVTNITYRAEDQELEPVSSARSTSD